MRVLVTGAFGNLGSLVARRLAVGGHAVTATDLETPANRSAAAALGGAVDVVWGDLRDGSLAGRVVEGQDAVIHLAAVIAPFSERSPELARAVNVDGTVRLLEAVEGSPRRPLFAFASSFAVFGLRQADPPPRTLAEPVVATDHYSRHKIECEERIRASDARWVILRLGAMVDSRMHHSGLEQARLAFACAAANRVEYLHPADAATAFVHALATPEAERQVHLIGGGSTCQVTHLELMDVPLGAMGVPLRPELFGERELYADWADTTRSQELLCYQDHSFDDYRREFRDRFRWIRPLVRPAAPLARLVMRRVLAAG